MSKKHKKKKAKLKAVIPSKPLKDRGPHVMVIVITKDKVEDECLASIHAQDYPDFDVMVHAMKSRHYHENELINSILNMIRNRNYCRQMALASDAKQFLLVDSDIKLPKNAISSLIQHQKDFICGWYPVKHYMNQKGWPASVIEGGTMIYFKEPMHSVVIAHSTGLGCAMVSRKLLERAEFNDGTDHTMPTNLGQNILIDDSSQFCFDAIAAGCQLYMDGDVICEHLWRQEKPVLVKEKKNAKHS